MSAPPPAMRARTSGGLPPRAGKIAIVLGILFGTWLLLDGLHQFITGNAVGLHGRLGTWATPAAAGRMTPMHFGGVLVALGVVWLVTANLYLFQNTLGTWKAMAILVVLSSWYTGLGTAVLLTLLALLLAARRGVRT